MFIACVFELDKWSGIGHLSHKPKSKNAPHTHTWAVSMSLIVLTRVENTLFCAPTHSMHAGPCGVFELGPPPLPLTGLLQQ